MKGNLTPAQEQQLRQQLEADPSILADILDSLRQLTLETPPALDPFDGNSPYAA